MESSDYGSQTMKRCKMQRKCKEKMILKYVLSEDDLSQINYDSNSTTEGMVAGPDQPPNKI